MFIFLASVNVTSKNDFDRLEGLLIRVADGDREAFSELYGLTSSSVYGYALSILKNRHDAEDVLQSCYLSVWDNAAGYTPNGKPMAWVLTVAKNLCFMKMRQDKKAVSFDNDNELFLPANDNTAEAAENRAVLEAALKVLSDGERQILMLHAVSGLKFREIADLLELPLATVLSKYHRAVKKLKTAVEG